MTVEITASLFYDLIERQLGTVVSVLSMDYRVLYANEAFTASFGTTPSAVIGRPISDLYSAEHVAAFLPHLERARSGENVTYERLSYVKGTGGVWFTVALRPVRDAKGVVNAVLQSAMPVHELKVAHEALRIANERLQAHIENSPLAVIELDAALEFIRLSSRAKLLLGFASADDAPAGSILAAVCPPGLNGTQPLANALVRLRDGKEQRNAVQCEHRSMLGETKYLKWFNSALTDASGRVTSVMCLIEDETDRVHATEQVRQMAVRDYLTGLANRTALLDRVSHAIESSKRLGQPVFVMFIDLDGFKHINDRYGHASGDEVLREVAQRLLRAVRVTDTVARIGGDEFVILVEGGDLVDDAPNQIAQRVLDALKSPCDFSLGSSTVGASIGIAKHPSSARSATDLVHQADLAMYEAKRAGSGVVRFASA
jgi:diguanylate cyclase (GGDEF)-like protein/PAS domain S-box-containing protein